MNLIICTTPFQVLLAEKIIAMNPDEKYIFRYISVTKNEKHLYYYNRLKSKIKDSQYIHATWRNKIDFLLFLFKMKLSSYQYSNSIKKVILGSIDNNHIHIHIHIIIHQKKLIVQTFDDGTANIDKNSFFYQKEIFSKKMKFVRFFLCKGTDLSFLKNKSEKHYTVYKNQSNILENVEYLKLHSYEQYSNISFNPDNRNEECKIFLGQPIYELDSTKSYTKEIHQNLVNKVLDECRISNYFPHPRETNLQIQNATIIDTPKIFEDYFFDNYNSNKKYTIYTFFSGSALSVADLPNVEIIVLKFRSFPVNLSSMYDIISNFNLSIIEI